MAKLTTNSGNSTAAFDMYLELSRKDAAYRRLVAMDVWNSLSPLEKRSLQDSARKLAGNNLRFGSEHTQSVLLLQYASTAALVNDAHPVPIIPIIS